MAADPRRGAGHLHWHVIARFDWDSHFPGAVWATPVRSAPAERLAAVESGRGALEIELGKLGRTA
jgi:diadenosine tetraphosphate (Ap4A) HIT family hydrolase